MNLRLFQSVPCSIETECESICIFKQINYKMKNYQTDDKHFVPWQRALRLSRICRMDYPLFKYICSFVRLTTTPSTVSNLDLLTLTFFRQWPTFSVCVENVILLQKWKIQKPKWKQRISLSIILQGIYIAQNWDIDHEFKKKKWKWSQPFNWIILKNQSKTLDKTK